MLAGWVVLMAGALSSFALFVVLATGTMLAGGHGPVASLRTLALALAAIPVAVAIVTVLARRSGLVQGALRRVVSRIDRGPRGHVVVASGRRFVERLRLAQPSPLAWAEAFGFALLNWLADLVCLLAAASAVSGHTPWRGILVAYCLALLVLCGLEFRVQELSPLPLGEALALAAVNFVIYSGLAFLYFSFVNIGETPGVDAGPALRWEYGVGTSWNELAVADETAQLARLGEFVLQELP